MIVALLNQPHGVGKMTLALHPAGWSFRTRHVTVIDADPQGRTLEWSEMRAQERLPRRFTAIDLTRNTLHRDAPNIARDVDRVIVDGPSHIAALTRSALLTVDLLLVPVQLPPIVSAPFAETLRLVNEPNTFRPRLRTRIVLNRRDVHEVDARDIARAPANSDPPMLTSCIGQAWRPRRRGSDRPARARDGLQHSSRPEDNCARGRSRKDGAMMTRDLKRTSMAHGGEADTSGHQPRANASINVANAERCIGGPTIDALPALRGRINIARSSARSLPLRHRAPAPQTHSPPCRRLQHDRPHPCRRSVVQEAH